MGIFSKKSDDSRCFFDGAREKIVTLECTVGCLNERLGKVEKQNTVLTDKLAAIYAQCRSNEYDQSCLFEGIRNQLKTLENRVGGLGNQNIEIRRDLVKATAGFCQHELRDDLVKRSVNEHFENLEKKLEGLKQLGASEENERIDDLCNRLSGQLENVAFYTEATAQFTAFSLRCKDIFLARKRPPDISPQAGNGLFLGMGCESHQQAIDNGYMLAWENEKYAVYVNRKEYDQ